MCIRDSDIGDEPKMLSDSGLDVWVGDRKISISKINAAQIKPNAIVMDDGFQNPNIKKDISILVFDENVGIGNGFCLPAGPLREPLWLGAIRCDAIVVVRESGLNSQPIKELCDVKKPVFLAQREATNPGLSGMVVGFAGIGYPKKFFDTLKNIPKVRLIESVSFEDHHDYTKEEIVTLFKLAKTHNASLVCTEKDWIKLPKQIRKKIKFLPIDIRLGNDFWTWIESAIKQKNQQVFENR